MSSDRQQGAHGAGDGTSTKPTVSIIVPFLNPPPGFMTAAVESVLAQGFTHWELLLVNDGSGPDATAHAESLASRDPARIRCVRHPDGRNHGIPATRNVGLQHARGELIAYLDSDDVWLPHKLEDQVRLLGEHPEADMLFGRSVYWQSWAQPPAGEDHVPELGVPNLSLLDRGEFLLLMLTSQLMVPCPSSVLVRATAARKVGGFEARVSNYYEDQGFYAKMSLAGSVLACDAVWDRYRLHPQSVIGGASRRQLVRARAQYLDWLVGYVAASGTDSARLRRAIRLERAFSTFPGGPRVLRYARRLIRGAAARGPG